MTFADLLTEYRIPFHAFGSKTREGWINFRCPWCHKDPYMGYNIRGRYVHCWSCGKHLLWETIQKLTFLPPKECWRVLGELPRENLPEKLQTIGTLKEPPGRGKLLVAHRQFLVSRGFIPENIIQIWGVQGTDYSAGKFSWRLYIPIHLRGEVVSFTSRVVGAKEPKYLSAKDSESAIPIENLIYGIDLCTNAIITVEGPLDTWAIGPGGGGLCGSRVSPAQLEQLSRFPLRVLCFDNEKEAQIRARRLLKDLSVFDGETINVVLESGKDASRADKKEVQTLRRKYLR